MKGSRKRRKGLKDSKPTLDSVLRRAFLGEVPWPLSQEGMVRKKSLEDQRTWTKLLTGKHVT